MTRETKRREAIHATYDRTRGSRPLNIRGILGKTAAVVVLAATANTCFGGGGEDDPYANRPDTSATASETPSDGTGEAPQEQKAAFRCETGSIENVEPTDEGARAYIDLKIVGAKTAKIVMPQVLEGGELGNDASLVMNPGTDEEQVSTILQYEVGSGLQDSISLVVDIPQDQYGEKFGIFVTNENGAQINCDSGVYADKAPLGEAPLFHNFANDELPTSY